MSKDSCAAVACAAVDSPSVKKAPCIKLDRGFDGGKKGTSHRRYLRDDTIGLPIVIHISTANISDTEGGDGLLWQAEKATQGLELIRAEQAYAHLFTQAANY